MPRPDSLLHHLLRARNRETRQPFSEVEIMAQSGTFLVAGAPLGDIRQSSQNTIHVRQNLVRYRKMQPFTEVEIMAQSSTFLVAGGPRVYIV